MKIRIAARRGFTLIELVVVVVVLAILAAVISPSVIRYVEKSKFQEVVTDFKAIETALVGYYADTGNLMPLNDIGGFTAGSGTPTDKHFLSGDGQTGWAGPYLSKVKVNSSFGGQYDIDVISSTQATIDLGTQTQLAGNYSDVLNAVNDTLDGDGDVTRGVVWGDSNGIHYGFNYVK